MEPVHYFDGSRHSSHKMEGEIIPKDSLVVGHKTLIDEPKAICIHIEGCMIEAVLIAVAGPFSRVHRVRKEIFKALSISAFQGN